MTLKNVSISITVLLGLLPAILVSGLTMTCLEAFVDRNHPAPIIEVKQPN